MQELWKDYTVLSFISWDKLIETLPEKDAVK